MSIENWHLEGAHDPFLEAAEAAARKAGGDPDAEPTLEDKDLDLFNKLMDWRTTEKDRSQAGRDEMAIDADFRDGLQWSEEDAKVLRDRGQNPVCFNRILPHVEWLLGTERRTRADYKILPRTKDDVRGAQAQSDVMKYLSDVNKERFHRSRAFDDAATVGIGWMEDSVNPDPTEEAIAVRYENWRYVWHDSASTELDLADARYVFRERWTDLDVAMSLWPEHAGLLRASAEGYDPEKERQEQFYLGQKLSDWEPYAGRTWNGFVYQTSTGALRFGTRQRVRIIEFQYRAPAKVKLCIGAFEGQEYDERNSAHVIGVANGTIRLWETTKLRMHLAIMTERGLLFSQRSPYRHDKFSLTPIWCYRRARDGQPYGVVRNLRGIQEDVNKRFARSLYRTSSSQIIADDNATDDWIEFREQARNPNGIVRKRVGSSVEFRADWNMAEADMKMMQQELMLFQESGGLTSENMGRETNAVSGRAVLARQTQGSIITERIFDNLRLGVQLQGEKRLSLIRQFMSAPRVLRLTDSRGNPDWLYINQVDPSTGEDNDITKTQSDFIVSEQDFRAGVRQAMFDTLMQLLTQFPPEISMQLLDLAIEFSDIPNKDEFVKRIRQVTGVPDPEEPDSPEAKAEAEKKLQAQAQAAAMQQRAVELELGEREAKIAKLNAEAQATLAEIESMGGDPTAHPLYAELQKMQQQLVDAQTQVAQVQAQLKDKAADAAIKAAQVEQQAATDRYRADKDAEAKVAAAEAAARATVEAEQARATAVVESARLQANTADIEGRMTQAVEAVKAELAQVKADTAAQLAAQAKEHAVALKEAKAEQREAAAAEREKQAGEKAKEREAAAKDKEKQAEAKAKGDGKAAAPPVINVTVNMPEPGKKSITLQTDDKGNITGGSIGPDSKGTKK
jgi:hypothetical protein